MSENTKHKVVLITGATGGIGKATALAFAKTSQYDLALHYNSASSSDRASLLTALQRAEPPSSYNNPISIRFYQADLSSYASVRDLHDKVVEGLGPVSILFANAGSMGGHKGVQSLSELPIDVFESTWRINAGSPILLAQLCLPYMEEQQWGRIVFNSSVAAFTGGAVGPHYASSKSALHGFIHWLAGNVAKNGVTVNGVAPAVIGETAMMRPDSEEAERALAAKIPVGRLGKPEEIADTVMWMVNTPYLTNKVITVDGGMYAY